MKSKVFVILTALPVFLLICFFAAAVKTPVQSQTNEKNSAPTRNEQPVELKSSTILEDIEQYKKLNPKAGGKDLAAFGNALLPVKGFNYNISLCDVIERKIKDQLVTKVPGENEFDHVRFSYLMNTSDSRLKLFNITAPNFDQCCCGYCYTEFPVVNITDQSMTLVADGQTFVVRRNEELSVSEDYALVDNQTMLKVIRQWQIPHEGYPLGISEDGKKLYFEIADDGPVVLEISDDGGFKFADRKEIKSGEGVYVENAPVDRANDYQTYKRFTVGGKSYTVRFSGPCT